MALTARNWRQKRPSLKHGRSVFLPLLVLVATILLWGRHPPSSEPISFKNPSVQRQLFLDLIRQHAPVNTKSEYTPLFKKIHKRHSSVLGFGMRGRELMDAVILNRAKDKDIVVVFEVGVWLGQSVVRWLNVSPKVCVVAIDPFLFPKSTDPKLDGLSESDKQHFGEPTFNRALAEYTITKNVKDAVNRTLLITGYHSRDFEFFFQQHQNKTAPDVDVFYLDGAKMPDIEKHVKFLENTFTEIIREFPSAVVSGDDWNHAQKERAKRSQETILQIAKSHGRVVYVKGDRTWIMVEEKDHAKYSRLAEKVLAPTVKL